MAEATLAISFCDVDGNYYPQDLERVVSTVEGVRDGQCVAFSRLDATGGEVAVVVAEARRFSPSLVDAIVGAVRAETGVTLGEVHLIKRGTLPKTSSGKVKRGEAKRRLETGELVLCTPDDANDSVLPPATEPAPSVTAPSAP
jgi:fatty-acyl-CoA synthase